MRAGCLARVTVVSGERATTMSQIVAMFDQVAASRERHLAIKLGHGDVVIGCFLEATMLGIEGAFAVYGQWPTSAAQRSLLMAYLRVCPESYLNAALKAAVAEMQDNRGLLGPHAEAA